MPELSVKRDSETVERSATFRMNSRLNTSTIKITRCCRLLLRSLTFHTTASQYADMNRLINLRSGIATLPDGFKSIPAEARQQSMPAMPRTRCLHRNSERDLGRFQADLYDDRRALGRHLITLSKKARRAEVIIEGTGRQDAKADLAVQQRRRNNQISGWRASASARMATRVARASPEQGRTTEKPKPTRSPQ